MRETDFITIVTSSYRDEVKFSINNSTFDSTLDIFSNFNTESDVSVFITDNDERFESSSLTSSGLLLYRHDLHDFFF